jgi:hypothetical protein
MAATTEAATEGIEANGNGRRISEAAAFRARVEERLRNLESELSELKSRINGLLYFIVGTVVAQALLRLLG